ncbi:hypothetical protein F5Y16DRAFT_396849 [Xylariaceae sp. FL0255]|nr:hypothetical protein F5Y16DRAFT_396849 [Xylariaceae sp. FL0255]
MATTTGNFKHIDTALFKPDAGKQWVKVDSDATSFQFASVPRTVHDLRGVFTDSLPATPEVSASADFNTDKAGFGVLRSPLPETLNADSFLDEAAVRGPYYDDIERLLRADCEAQLSNSGKGKKVAKVVIFDHTIRRRTPDAARAPVNQVHVDQTTDAAIARVRRHLPEAEAEEFLKPGRRFQLINVWRPIGHPAADHPLAVVDWRSTEPKDFIAVDLLYPKRKDSGAFVSSDSNSSGSSTPKSKYDHRGTEVRPDESTYNSTEGYEARGETMAVAANESHRFHYVKDMTPDEVVLLKCYDSWGQGERDGVEGLATRTPHTAFDDPATPKDAKFRQSIEVRALVFYEE